MKIGVISDTHARNYSQLPQNLLKALEKVDLIVHAGDIVTMDVIRGLETVAPVKGVCGNMDLPEVRPWQRRPGRAGKPGDAGIRRRGHHHLRPQPYRGE
ncbi:MAG: metallophosphoesterase family protein [Chloroflexi bacterium]|nr:metallophosphoesterase family protein [Chloroflexota bacterium]